MKTQKRRIEYFSFYNHTGIEAHFAEMARKGWLIESISNLYWTYRKIEPKDIHFSVTYYPRASDFDSGPSEEQQTFHDFCAHTGWKLACSWHQMQVFYNEKESPIPLDTDPIMEVYGYWISAVSHVKHISVKDYLYGLYNYTIQGMQLQ